MSRMNDHDFMDTIEPERYELHAEPRYQFAIDRRAFLKAVGGGLAVFCLVDRIDAQDPGRRPGGGGARGAPQEIGAWLHVDEQGTVTVYSGKAEVGQNIRTSLAQAVAEELRVAPESVRLVLGDTQLTPFDQGTFGSRTTPDMAQRLRRTASAARELLIDRAAETWNCNRDRLTAADGKVVRGETKDALAYGALTKGRKLTKTISDRADLTPSDQWKVSGQSLPKAGGRAFVTGQHHYTSDVALPGMLHGKVLRPESFGATLQSLDTAAAEAMPGVVVVRDGEFVGVAAASERDSARALRAIKAQWKPAAQVSGRDLYTHLKLPRGDQGGGRGGGRGSDDREGDLQRALEQSEVKLRNTYHIAYIAHAPLEPRAAVAHWENGTVTVWTGTQRPFGVRGELASAFGLSENDARVIVPDTGAGYGGKHSGEAAVEAARLARAAGKPVKLVWTRAEEFTWAYFRPAGVIEIASGARRDGTLHAWECHNYNSGGSGLRTPYDVANRFTTFHPSESPLRQGSYRALAATANHFARESHMDELAHALKLDPLAFRLANLKEPRMRAVLEASAKAFGWGKQPAEGHGLGLACGTEKGGFVGTCAEVFVDRSTGAVRVTRVVCAFECGAVVNPEHLKNQVEGALVQGLGGALFEAIEFEEGKITNARFSRYRVPRFSDMPVIDVILIDRRDLPPSGAGETPIVALAPAIGNAIFQATGQRLTSLPMAPLGLKGL
jgi:isoquinoline 1-oxidoreductase